MRLIILPSAIADLKDGIDFYERQQSGLGSYFNQCLLADIDSLHSFYGIHRKAFGFHRMLARKFSHAIFYSIEGDAVIRIGSRISFNDQA